jgi:hypothetical protein
MQLTDTAPGLWTIRLIQRSPNGRPHNKSLSILARRDIPSPASLWGSIHDDAIQVTGDRPVPLRLLGS